jgi:hypothetical protein
MATPAAPGHHNGVSETRAAGIPLEVEMSATVFLFDPRPAAAEATAQALGAVGSLAGKVVGFIDNAKPNFRELVDDLADLLTSRYGVAAVLKRQKPVATVPATAAVLAELSAQCDLVITGSGD